MLFWNALTAIGTSALAVATFVIIWRDRNVELERKKPSLIVTSVYAELLDTEVLETSYVDILKVQCTLTNLGVHHIRVQEVTITKTFVMTEKENLTDKKPVNIIVTAGSTKSIEVLVELQNPANLTSRSEDLFYKELRIYFQYGATGQNYHRVALSFIKFVDDHFIFSEDHQKLAQNVMLEEKSTQVLEAHN